MTVEAYVFITTTNPGPRKACQSIRGLSGVVRADALFGTPDVVAIVAGMTSPAWMRQLIASLSGLR
jgi:hypothetical protein